MSFKNLRMRPAGFALACLVTLSACGDAVDKTNEVATDASDATREVTEEATQGASKLADDLSNYVADGASSVGNMFSRASKDLHELTLKGVSDIGTWIDGPSLEQRRQKCAEEKGTFASVVEVGACVEGKTKLTVDGKEQEQDCDGDGEGELFADQCVHTTWNGTYYFNDGPSVPPTVQRLGEIHEHTNFVLWNSVFWEAAVNHDYCYHHGGATYGYDQETCDGQFLDDLMALCSSNPDSDAEWFSEDACTRNAHGMYSAVRACGSANYGLMNTKVKYPAYEPMYKKLGLDEQPVNEELRGLLDKVF